MYIHEQPQTAEKARRAPREIVVTLTEEEKAVSRYLVCMHICVYMAGLGWDDDDRPTETDPVPITPQERRRERARQYSHMVRRRQEQITRELIAIVEHLTVPCVLVLCCVVLCGGGGVAGRTVGTRESVHTLS